MFHFFLMNLDGESLHAPFPTASYLYLCCARSRLAAYRHRYLALVPTWCPITTVARRAARLISVLRYPLLSFLKAPSQNGKRRPGSRCAAVIYLCMRLSYVAWLWVSGLFMRQWRLSASSLSKRSRSTGLCRGAWLRRYQSMPIAISLGSPRRTHYRGGRKRGSRRYLYCRR
jgi:hypothetical protein